MSSCCRPGWRLRGTGSATLELICLELAKVANDAMQPRCEHAASTFATWAVFLKEQTDRLASRRQAALLSETPFGLSDISFFDGLTVYNLALVPCVAAYRLAEAAAEGAADPSSSLLAFTAEFNDVLAVLTGTLQVSLALSLLNYVSIFRALGPLLITVVQLVADALRFSAILGVVVLGYANGFYSLVHFGVTEEYLASLPFGDYSYTHILTAMGLWLAGQPEVEIFEGLSPGVQLGGSVIFWSFIVTSYFVLLNLLIAIFNTTYERIQRNSFAEWLFIRLRTTIEFEADKSLPGVQTYYDQLEGRDNQRAVRGEVGTDDLR